MGQKSKATWACLANLANKSARPYQATVEDASDSEHDLNWVPIPELDEASDSKDKSDDSDGFNWVQEQVANKQQDQVFVVDVMDCGSDEDSDTEMDEDDNDEAEIRNDAELLTFSNTLQRAQEVAAAAERKRRVETQCLKHYKGNSMSICPETKDSCNGGPTINFEMVQGPNK